MKRKRQSHYWIFKLPKEIIALILSYLIEDIILGSFAYAYLTDMTKNHKYYGYESFFYKHGDDTHYFVTDPTINLTVWTNMEYREGVQMVTWCDNDLVPKLYATKVETYGKFKANSKNRIRVVYDRKALITRTEEVASIGLEELFEVLWMERLNTLYNDADLRYHRSYEIEHVYPLLDDFATIVEMGIPVNYCFCDEEFDGKDYRCVPLKYFRFIKTSGNLKVTTCLNRGEITPNTGRDGVFCQQHNRLFCQHHRLNTAYGFECLVFSWSFLDPLNIKIIINS